MVNYVNSLRDLVSKVTNGIPVTTTYPDTDIVPIVILSELNQVEIFKCDVYEHAASTISIEIYTKDISTRTELRDRIDKYMKDLRYNLVKKEDLDNTTIYVSKLTYECEVIDREGSVSIYSKKQ